MREILFRGKRMDNGELVFGDLIREPWGYCIQVVTGSGNGYSRKKYAITEETVGQYTGLKDKNGKRIFEGDIVRTHYANARKADFVEQVVFHNGRFSSLYILREFGNGKMWANLPDDVPHLPLDKTPYMEWCEIIGNIYDNPEILGGGQNNEC